ncbi:MAG: sulfatase, partial [Candidatus Dormibacteraeota bacterium]|nr:sulfatase [Candidatus Dormibacteraeota bacterium]
MRALYIDIDSLRPDHLGCYGYQRDTSPNIDRLASEGVRFTEMWVSDVPCLPSRTALWSGRFGFHTGVVNHGGTAAQPFVEGPTRANRDLFGRTGWMRLLRDRGLRTATVSSFGERHSAWHWYAGYREVLNPGEGGLETADQVNVLVLDWLRRNGERDGWFLHVNYWDPHTPYRTPLSFGEPFADDVLPGWVTEEARQRMWKGFGPHSAQEPWGFDLNPNLQPREPAQIDSMDAVRRVADGYDTGIRYADQHLGQLLQVLEDQGVLDETAIIVGADHGEMLGELNVWGDHQAADIHTCRVPWIVRWPGVQPRVDRALHYQLDWPATMVQLLGGEVPEGWDGVSFASAFTNGTDRGRPYLVLSQNTWASQRSVRFGNHLCARTYHDGYKDFAPVMLFDVEADPHEEYNLAAERPDLVDHAMALLAEWQQEAATTSRYDV